MSRRSGPFRAASTAPWFLLAFLGAGTAVAQGQAGGAGTARFGELPPEGSVAPNASATAPVPEGAPTAPANPVATSGGPAAPVEPAAVAPAPSSPEEPRRASRPAYDDHRAAAAREDEEEYQAWRRRKRRSWYGWQTLVADGASFTFIVAASGSSHQGDADSVLATVGVLGYFFGAPSVHWAHENVGKGFASLGIRGGSTTLFVLGAVSCFDGWAGGGGNGDCTIMWLGFLGMIAAIPIDAAAFAYEDVVPEEASLGPLRRLRLSPVLGPVARPWRTPYGEVAAEARHATPSLGAGLFLEGEF